MYRNLPKRDLTYCHVHQSYQAIEGGLQEYRVPQTTAFDPPVIPFLFILLFGNKVTGKLSLLQPLSLAFSHLQNVGLLELLALVDHVAPSIHPVVDF